MCCCVHGMLFPDGFCALAMRDSSWTVLPPARRTRRRAASVWSLQRRCWRQPMKWRGSTGRRLRRRGRHRARHRRWRCRRGRQRTSRLKELWGRRRSDASCSIDRVVSHAVCVPCKSVQAMGTADDLCTVNRRDEGVRRIGAASAAADPSTGRTLQASLPRAVALVIALQP